MTNKSNKSNYKSYLLLFITLCIINSSLSLRGKALKALSKTATTYCYEIVQQNGKDYKITLTYTAPKTTTINLAIKFKINCNNPGDLKVIVDNWLADGKLINSDVTASITGTTCLPLSAINFSGRELSLYVLGSQSTCASLQGIEFTLNLTYTSSCLIRCSTICKLTIEQEPATALPGSVRFLIDSNALDCQGCPNPFNLILSVINSEGNIVAQVSIGVLVTVATEATINNLPVGTYTTGLVSGNILCNSGYVDIFSSSDPFTITSETTTDNNIILGIRPFAQVTFVITNFPSAVTQNIPATIIDNSTGSTVASVTFSLPSATVNINLPNGSYGINLPGAGDALSGDFFSPIVQTFTVNNVDQVVNITYLEAAVHGVSFAFTTYTGTVELGFTSSNYIISNLSASSPSTGNMYYFPNQDVNFAVVSPTGVTVTYDPPNAIITSCTTSASVDISTSGCD